MYLAKEEWDKAEADASKCVELNDVFIKGYFRLATAQMELGKYDEAMATARKGTQKNPGKRQPTYRAPLFGFSPIAFVLRVPRQQ